jgi:hypothetical protein
LPPPAHAAAKRQQGELSERWESEREDLNKVQRVREEIDRVNIEIGQVRSR